MSRMHEDIEHLESAGRALAALCKEPETGLASWHMLLQDTLSRIAQHSGGYLTEANVTTGGTGYASTERRL